MLDGKVPVAVSARRRPVRFTTRSLFGDKQHVKIVIMGPREIGKVGAELKAQEHPGDSRPRAGAAGS